MTHQVAIEETKSMKRIIRAVVMALLLAPGMLWADDLMQQFKAGSDAAAAGDYEKAYGIFLPLAEQGHAATQLRLGFMYDVGLGVPQDYAEAVRWYRLAAEQGNAQAQLNLGFMYDEGQGVIQDYSTTHMWFNIAARNGDSVAVNNRDAAADRMTPEAIAEAQRRARICIESGYQDCD